MAVGIYKKGQGYWTRLMSAIAWGTLILMGCNWMWGILSDFKIDAVPQQIYIQATGGVLFFAVFGWIAFHLLGRKPRTVDFMIATEGEMKKVNWSTRREILGSTWIVIGLTVLIALLCLVFDLAFQRFFMWVDVLDSINAVD